MSTERGELDPLRDMVRELNEQAGFPPEPQLGGGRKNVGEGDTLGWSGECWCGQSYNHDWPGREDGAPHPRYPR